MTDELDPAYLRGKAAEIRARAAGISDPAIRAELLDIADKFERMAERLEGRPR
jgi:hypothetical protein